MSMLKKVMFYLALMVLSPAVPAAVIFSNLSDTSAGSFAITGTNWFAAKTTVGTSAVTIDAFTVKLSPTSDTDPLFAGVCPDNAGLPDLSSCSSTAFTTVDTLVTGTPTNIRYTGSYAAAANATVWVVIGTSGSGKYQWHYSSTPTPWAYSMNEGTTWGALAVSGQGPLFSISSQDPVAPTPVPTLSEWALISFAMLIAGFGVYQQRRRQL